MENGEVLGQCEYRDCIEDIFGNFHVAVNEGQGSVGKWLKMKLVR